MLVQMVTPPEFQNTGCSLGAKVVGDIFMEEVKFEEVLEGYLHQIFFQA